MIADCKPDVGLKGLSTARAFPRGKRASRGAMDSGRRRAWRYANSGRVAL